MTICINWRWRYALIEDDDALIEALLIEDDDMH